jgi:hypothetical protein
MGKKSRPILVKEKIKGEWYKKNYFCTTEEAEKWCIEKSKSVKREFSIVKNK